MSMVDSISSMAMDTPIATILVVLLVGTVSFSSSAVVKLVIVLVLLLNEFVPVNCV